MRRQGNFSDSPVYGAQQIQNPHSDFQGQFEAFTPERDQLYSDSQPEGQWKWERDGPDMSRPTANAIYNNEGQAIDSSRSYYRGQMDPKSGMKKQGSDLRAQTQQIENPKPGYDNNRGMQTFEGLEQKFVDDIGRLAKDQIEAEDAEISKHREKINTISTWYEEELGALRARLTDKREEIMRKESQARQQQYKQQAMGMMDQYHPNTVGPVNIVPSDHPQGYVGNAQDPAGVVDEPSRSYGSYRFDGYGERGRLHGGARDPGFESRSQYAGGISRFY